MANILIGIGGTGAKVVEAALTLFTAGLGPTHTYVGLIDQDKANGNVSRTQTRLTNLQQFQQMWGRPQSPSFIDWSRGEQNAGRIDFGGVPVDQLFGNHALWFPQGDDQSLSGIVGQDLSPQQRALFDLLFMKGPEEQDLQLGEGYRGRAHVGAAALVAAMLDPGNGLVTTLRDLMERPEPVRIFLVGSAFGGTGASGFPTLARELHRIRSGPDFNNRAMVSIGGALMLPYFAFGKPDEDGRLVVTTDELLPKARLALEYYGRLFQSEKTFDRFYVAGWDPLFNLGYHKAGNFEQRNPPLLPELVAATAAVDFLTRDHPYEPGGRPPVMLSARQDGGIRWGDLPGGDVEDKLAQLVRFCAYWMHITEPLLAHKPLFRRGANWTVGLRGKLTIVDQERELLALRKVCRDILEWAAGLQATAFDRWAPGLWDVSSFLDGAHAPTATDPIALADQPFAPEDGFDRLIRVAANQPHPNPASVVYDALQKNGAAFAAGTHAGYGRCVAATYRAVGER